MPLFQTNVQVANPLRLDEALAFLLVTDLEIQQRENARYYATRYLTLSIQCRQLTQQEPTWDRTQNARQQTEAVIIAFAAAILQNHLNQN